MRDAFLYVVVGRPGAGKSTFVEAFASRYAKRHSSRSVVIAAAQAGLKAPSGARRITHKPEFAEKFWAYCGGMENCLMVFDDARRLIDTYAGEEYVSLSVNRRHKSADLMLVFHSLSEVPRKVLMHSNYLRMFRVNDALSARTIERMPPYVEEPEKAVRAARRLRRFESLLFRDSF